MGVLRPPLSVLEITTKNEVHGERRELSLAKVACSLEVALASYRYESQSTPPVQTGLSKASTVMRPVCLFILLKGVDRQHNLERTSAFTLTYLNAGGIVCSLTEMCTLQLQWHLPAMIRAAMSSNAASSASSFPG